MPYGRHFGVRKRSSRARLPTRSSSKPNPESRSNTKIVNANEREISKTKLTFLGHVIDSDGIHADPEKATAIRELKTPTTVPKLRRFLVMLNQLGKFTLNLAELTQPFRELLLKSRAGTWGPAQSTTFKQVKDEISKPSTLALYDPAALTKFSADASSMDLELYCSSSWSHWKAVVFVSQAMTDTERQYAQIEKEALTTTWAFEKFTITGKHISIETVHKPVRSALAGSKATRHSTSSRTLIPPSPRPI